ncbi:MAG: Fe-S cluster assembly protein SufD [Propionibacteriaceae bacterium]|jgi:Fe-S cluster assembly protein SufD|nr:Fe-S cluster assembly protein SufD [Propionibacteriaceae bacterium]
MEIASQQVESHLHPKPSFDVADFPMPTGREEVWRFAPLPRFAELLTEPPTDFADIQMTLQAPVGVTLSTLGVGVGVRGSVLLPVDRVSVLAAKVSQARHIRIADAVRLTEPIVITVTGKGERAAEHIVIESGVASEAIIVVEHRGSAVFCGNIEVVVKDAAKITVVSVQDWAPDALHGGMHAAAVGTDAQYRHVMMTFGGDAVRIQNSVYYTGSGGNAELYGLYFADAGQYQEHRLSVDQNAAHTTSYVDYRGALQGKGAHTVWVGDVFIRRQAVGISSYEANKNLVLTDGCRADSVPNLEIETGNIKGAGHSSTTGRFDDNQLFYLMSRGLSSSEAKRLVIQGFFYDIIRRIGIAELEERLKTHVDAELAKTIDRAETSLCPPPLPEQLRHEAPQPQIEKQE